MERPDLEDLLDAAVRAPSGDNTQPWRFVVDAERDAIALEIDPTRDPSPMNAGQRMARIALGAALENLIRLARRRGWDVRVEGAAGSAVARAVLHRAANPVESPAGSDPTLAARVTNRRPYDARPVPSEVLARLVGETPEFQGVRTHWITDRARVAEWSRWIARADALMFGDPAMRRAFLAKVDLRPGPVEPPSEGLTMASLELSAADRRALAVMGRLPDGLLRLLGIGRVFASKARQLVASASGLCLIGAPDGAEATDLLVGRAMQRAWLALTAEGVAAQPMMSWMVLENVAERGSPAQREALGPDRLAGLFERLRGLAPELDGARPAFLLRFGYAPAPSGRTIRRGWQEVTRFSPVSRPVARVAP